MVKNTTIKRDKGKLPPTGTPNQEDLSRLRRAVAGDKNLRGDPHVHGIPVRDSPAELGSPASPTGYIEPSQTPGPELPTTEPGQSPESSGRFSEAVKRAVVLIIGVIGLGLPIGGCAPSTAPPPGTTPPGVSAPTSPAIAPPPPPPTVEEPAPAEEEEEPYIPVPDDFTPGDKIPDIEFNPGWEDVKTAKDWDTLEKWSEVYWGEYDKFKKKGFSDEECERLAYVEIEHSMWKGPIEKPSKLIVGHWAGTDGTINLPPHSLNPDFKIPKMGSKELLLLRKLADEKQRAYEKLGYPSKDAEKMAGVDLGFYDWDKTLPKHEYVAGWEAPAEGTPEYAEYVRRVRQATEMYGKLGYPEERVNVLVGVELGWLKFSKPEVEESPVTEPVGAEAPPHITIPGLGDLKIPRSSPTDDVVTYSDARTVEAGLHGTFVVFKGGEGERLVEVPAGAVVTVSGGGDFNLPSGTRISGDGKLTLSGGAEVEHTDMTDGGSKFESTIGGSFEEKAFQIDPQDTVEILGEKGSIWLPKSRCWLKLPEDSGASLTLKRGDGIFVPPEASGSKDDRTKLKLPGGETEVRMINPDAAATLEEPSTEAPSPSEPTLKSTFREALTHALNTPTGPYINPGDSIRTLEPTGGPITVTCGETGLIIVPKGLLGCKMTAPAGSNVVLNSGGAIQLPAGTIISGEGEYSFSGKPGEPAEIEVTDVEPDKVSIPIGMSAEDTPRSVKLGEGDSIKLNSLGTLKVPAGSTVEVRLPESEGAEVPLRIGDYCQLPPYHLGTEVELPSGQYALRFPPKAAEVPGVSEVEPEDGPADTAEPGEAGKLAALSEEWVHKWQHTEGPMYSLDITGVDSGVGGISIEGKYHPMGVDIVGKLQDDGKTVTGSFPGMWGETFHFKLKMTPEGTLEGKYTNRDADNIDEGTDWNFTKKE